MKWIKIKCPECESGTIYILPTWKNTPRYCDLCKARRVDKKERGLRLYIRDMRNKKNLTEEDRKELIFISEIEKRLDLLKKIHGENEREIFEELIKIKKVRSILFQWNRNLIKSRSHKRSSFNYRGEGSKKVTGFVQGGSPGLKK